MNSKIDLEREVFMSMNWGRLTNKYGTLITKWDVIASTLMYILWGISWLCIFCFMFYSKLKLETIITMWSLVWSLLICIIPIIFIYIGIRQAFQLKLYNKLEKYFNIKEFLESKITLLENLKKKNEENSKIDLIDLEKFTLILNDLSEAYKNIWHPMTLINKNSLYFSEFAKKRLDQFIVIEKGWLLDYMLLCKSILQSWLQDHIEKLRELEQEIKKPSSHRAWVGQEILRVAAIRLDSHIDSLEGVLVHT